MRKNGRWLALRWGLGIAIRIDRWKLLLWLLFSAMLAVLPAVALHYQRAILAGLSDFLAGGGGGRQVITQIIFYGAVLTVSSLSARFNDDLLYMLMFDAYYLGLEEVMMDAAQRIPVGALLHKETGDEYFAAISRCGSLTDVTSSGCVLLGRVITLASLMAVAVSVSVPIAVFTLAYICLVFFINARYAGKVRIVWKNLRDDMRRAEHLEKLVRQGDTAKETRVYDSAGFTAERWERTYGKVEGAQLRNRQGTAKISFVTRLGFYGFLAIVMAYALPRVPGGGMQPDLLLMLYTLCISIADAVAAIPKSYQRLDYGLYGLDIQRRFFEGTQSIDPAAEAKKADTPLDEAVVFEAKDLSFAYGAGKPVLHGLSFSILRGETVALVGANGSGKTTLIKLLLGLSEPASGSLTCMGRAYPEYRQQFIAEHTGSFFQDFYLFHLTAGENVGAGDVKNIENRELIAEAIRAGGAEKVVAKLPHGMDTLLGKQVYKEGAVLSGGEGQRVAVSRAFMSDKPVMVFDEPASMLDPVAEMEQFDSVRQKAKSRTALLVSHRVGFARLADRILVLEDGRLVEQGAHDDLMQKNGVYARMFREQAHWYKGVGQDA